MFHLVLLIYSSFFNKSFVLLFINQSVIPGTKNPFDLPASHHITTEGRACFMTSSSSVNKSNPFFGDTDDDVTTTSTNFMCTSSRALSAKHVPSLSTSQGFVMTSSSGQQHKRFVAGGASVARQPLNIDEPSTSAVNPFFDDRFELKHEQTVKAR